MYVEIMKKHNYANGFYESMTYMYHISFLFFICNQFYPFVHWENGLQIQELSWDIVQNILSFQKVYYWIELACLILMPYIHVNPMKACLSNMLLQFFYYGMQVNGWDRMKIFVCVVSYLDTVYSLLNLGIKYNPSKMMFQIKMFAETILVLTALHHIYEVIVNKTYMEFDTLHIILYGFVSTNVMQKCIEISQGIGRM
jgi:hypothetical protein